MQTLTETHMIIVKDYDHMTTIYENLNQMKLTHLLLIYL